MNSIVDEALSRESGAAKGARKYVSPPGPGAGKAAEDETTDTELSSMLAGLRPKIKVVGCGGGGSNTVARLVAIGIEGADLIAANTDAAHLHMIDVPKKVLLGKRTTRGLGAGALPKLGEQAAREAEDDLNNIISGSDLVFITCGLGGGTGTGSAAVVAEIARKQGALAVGCATLPFRGEGKMRMDNALWGMERLKNVVDTLILIPNDKLLEITPRLPLAAAFKVADEILMVTIKGITEVVTKPGLVNMDFNDIRTIMKGGGYGAVGIGGAEGPSDIRPKEATMHALNSPLLDVDLSTAQGVLVNIIGGNDISIEEANEVVEMVHQSVGKNARIIWGSAIDPTMEKKLKVMVVATGVRPKVVAPERRDEPLKRVK
ncbi:MAG: cell division protein FtsZ [Euryarchaeota archaeon]|nr:cell division protein FtsZ [Euryarchaeota archaeon]